MSDFPNFIIFNFTILNVREISSVSYHEGEVTISMKSGLPIVKSYFNSVDATKAVHDLWELIKKSHKANAGRW